MRYLLDINLLLALMDQDHAFHQRAHKWWAGCGGKWASCPLTENGLVRIITSPAYSKTADFTVAEMAGRLRAFAGATDHGFWPDSLSLRDERHFQHATILTGKHLTDIYLLALAVANNGCLATFDRHIALAAVKQAEGRHLMVI